MLKNWGLLTKFIDFRRIKGQIFVDVIEPLNIIPEIVLNFYRNMAKSCALNLNHTRGIPVWNASACGSGLILDDDGKVVRVIRDCGYKSVRSKMTLDNESIFEWDVIFRDNEELYSAYVGVCAPENFDYEASVEVQSTNWVLDSSDGQFWDSENWKNYCPSFGNGSKIRNQKRAAHQC